MSVYSSDYASSEGDESDDDLILTIDLNNTIYDQAVRAARTATSDLPTRANYQSEDLEIVASTFYRGADDPNLRIITSSKRHDSDDKDCGSREHWM